MSGIVTPITDIINKLKTLSWPNNSGQTPALYAAVWNNQLKYLQTGASYDFPLPAAFVEALPNHCMQLGFGFTETDVNFRIHLGMEQLDAGDGTLDQNLAVFALRDAIIALLTDFEPTACSSLMKTGEELDYNHNNLYVYTIDFLCSFIDDRGSKYYVEQTNPPANLEITTGDAPIEILSVAYSSNTLTVQYRLADIPQQVKFTLPVAGLVDAGTQQTGDNTFVKTSYTLSAGSYSLTATAMGSGFTSTAFDFTV